MVVEEKGGWEGWEGEGKREKGKEMGDGDGYVFFRDDNISYFLAGRRKTGQASNRQSSKLVLLHAAARARHRHEETRGGRTSIILAMGNFIIKRELNIGLGHLGRVEGHQPRIRCGCGSGKGEEEGQRERDYFVPSHLHDATTRTQQRHGGLRPDRRSQLIRYQMGRTDWGRRMRGGRADGGCVLGVGQVSGVWQQQRRESEILADSRV